MRVVFDGLKMDMPGKLKHTTRYLIYTIFAMVAGMAQATAQVEPMPTYDIFIPDYQTYRVEKEAYSFNTIRYMFQDRDKKLWISTVHDFKRTNGYHFFSLPEIVSGVQHNIDHISDGHYWNDSTHYLVEQKDNHVLRPLALHTEYPIRTRRLDEARGSQGNLLFYDVVWNENAYEVWVDSTQSLKLRVIAPTGEIEHIINIPSLDGEITHFAVTRDHVWFVLNQQKIIQYNLTSEGELVSPTQLVSNGNIFIFHTDRLDNLWVSTWDGVYQVRNYSNGHELSLVVPLKQMQEIYEDWHGNLIFGSIAFPRRISSVYMYVREGGRWIDLHPLMHHFQDLHFFTGNDFRKEIFIGAQNNLSTIRFTDHPISKEIFSREESEAAWGFDARGLTKSDTTLFALAAKQGLWTKNMITGEEELIRYRHPVSREYLGFEQPGTIEVDYQGNLWFASGERMGTDESRFLITYNPQRKSKDLIRLSSPITALRAGMERDLWITTSPSENSQSLIRYDVTNHQTMARWDLVKDIGRINDIYLWNIDTVYMATDFGFFQYDLIRQSIRHIPLHSNPHLRTIIFSIFYYDHKFFLAGRDGLFVLKPGNDPEVQRYNNSNGLRNNIVTSVFRERENKYWLATLYGVTMLNLDQNLVLNYSVRDGLPENQFNIHSYYQDATGFYLGYHNGVIQLDLKDSMNAYFEDFGLDHMQLYYRGEEKPEILLTPDNQLDIPPNVSYVMLFPTSYASYFVDYFYCKLINKTISDTLSFSAAKGAILPKLNAGTYNLELKTYDRYGNILPGTLNYTLTINQHFYQATWFRVVILLLINAIVAYMVFCWFRVRNRKRRLAHEQANRLSELELQVLQAQLNPHFIFNTISAIQYYIQDHDDERADRYLTSFSRLMRMYLDTSKSSFITLRSEIDLLTNYLDLEIMVSDGKFEAHYEVDPELDLDTIVIPTMTIQPFVENAIQHGLFNKEGRGNIYLRFILLSDDELLCEVEDDGIGRAEAARINAQNTHKPESRALKIIDEKLQVLKETRGVQIDIEIIDKYHEQQSMGTLVRIKFPVMKQNEGKRVVRQSINS